MSTLETETFDAVYHQLLTFPPPLLPPPKPCSESMAHRISGLMLHPTLEAALHLLNHDLPSAHFLVRHMQAAPKFEGMYLHGILHRIEGDYDNARAWYGNVADSDVFKSVWTKSDGSDSARDFIARIEQFKRSQQDQNTKERLEQESIAEIKAVIDFCSSRFGTDKVSDASDAWRQPTQGKVKEMGQEMVTGGKGFRKF